jgi:hypothetical protein
LQFFWAKRLQQPLKLNLSLGLLSTLIKLYLKDSQDCPSMFNQKYRLAATLKGCKKRDLAHTYFGALIATSIHSEGIHSEGILLYLVAWSY